MSVVVENTSPLGRRLIVTIPANEVAKAVESRLSKLAQTARINGYRPGKAPKKLLELQYKDGIRMEVTQDLIKSSLGKSLEQEKLNPVDRPAIESLKAEPDADMEYTAVLEIYPEVELKDLKDNKLKKKKVDIQEADIDHVLEQMRKQHANWKEVTRSAQEGDKLIVDLQGLVNGEPDLGMQKEGTFFVLDTETMASPFGALKDAKAGDKITIDLPAMEGATASKQVIVQVQKVEEPELPVLDDSFAERLEVEGGLTALRAEVKKSMEERLEQSIKNELKGQLIDILLEQYQFELPKTLVDAELKRISNQRRNQQEAASAATLLKSAEDGVRLGLIYSEVIKQHGIKADEARIRAHVQRVASMFNGSPEIINMLYKDKKMMNNFYSQVLEEQIIEKLLEQVQYEEEAANYLDVIKLNEAEYNADFYDEDEGEDEHEQCDHSDCDHDHHGHAHHEHAE